jgi:protein ImuB
LRFERRFAEPVAHERAVAAAFAELLAEGARVLEERGLGGRRFRLTLDRSDGAKRRLAIETGAPTRDAALVLRLFDERIAALADPLDPGFGYDRLTLHIRWRSRWRRPSRAGWAREGRLVNLPNWSTG